MPNLNFKIISAQAIKYAPDPTLGFQIEINNAMKGEIVQSKALKCRIELARRDTVRLLNGMEVTAVVGQEMSRGTFNIQVPQFKRFTYVKLFLPCDKKTCNAIDQLLPHLRDGIIPIVFLFSGNFSCRKADGTITKHELSAPKRADLKMPVSVWRNLKELNFPAKPNRNIPASLAP